MEARELNLKDAFGHPYTIRALSRVEIERRIWGLTIQEIIEKAYSSMIRGVKSGHAELNIVTGELVGSSGEETRGAHYIELYNIDKDAVISNFWELRAGILDDYEYANAKGLIKVGKASNMEDALQVMGINFGERFGKLFVLIRECLKAYPEEEARVLDTKDINSQLDELYGKDSGSW